MNNIDINNFSINITKISLTDLFNVINKIREFQYKPSEKSSINVVWFYYGLSIFCKDKNISKDENYILLNDLVEIINEIKYNKKFYAGTYILVDVNKLCSKINNTLTP